MKGLADRLAFISDRITAVLGNLCGAIVLIMGFLILFEVLMRYVVGRPPLLADELSRYMLVGMTFLGMSYVWKEKGHVRVEALATRLSRDKANRLRMATLIVALVFVVILFVGSLDFIERSISQTRTSDSWMRVPLVWPELTIVVGSLLLASQVATSIWRAIGIMKSGGALEQEASK